MNGPDDLQLPGAGRRYLRLLFDTPSDRTFLQASYTLRKHGYPLERATSAERGLLLTESTFIEIDGRRLEGPPFSSVGGREGAEACIRSRVRLDLVRFGRPLYFDAELQGRITTAAPAIERSPLHPWLSPDTPEAFFVAAGHMHPLAALSADEYHRTHPLSRALSMAAARLDEYSAVLNLPADAQRYRRPFVPGQSSIGSERSQIWLIVGKRACGKTTFAEYGGLLGAKQYEASTVIRMYQAQSGDSGAPFTTFVRDLHEQRGEDLVLRTFVEEYGLADEPFAVVSGVRRFADLLYLARQRIDYHMVYIDSPVERRYARYLQRARDASPMSAEEFTRESEAHDEVYAFAEELAEIRITNDGTLERFLAQIDFVLRGDHGQPAPEGVVIGSSERRQRAVEQVIAQPAHRGSIAPHD